MTQDRYMARGKLHTLVAEALDYAISGALPLRTADAEAENAFEVRRQGFEPRTR